jgi:hypothetical protein
MEDHMTEQVYAVNLTAAEAQAVLHGLTDFLLRADSYPQPDPPLEFADWPVIRAAVVQCQDRLLAIVQAHSREQEKRGDLGVPAKPVPPELVAAAQALLPPDDRAWAAIQLAQGDAVVENPAHCLEYLEDVAGEEHRDAEDAVGETEIAYQIAVERSTVAEDRLRRVRAALN